MLEDKFWQWHSHNSSELHWNVSRCKISVNYVSVPLTSLNVVFGLTGRYRNTTYTRCYFKEVEAEDDKRFSRKSYESSHWRETLVIWINPPWENHRVIMWTKIAPVEWLFCFKYNRRRFDAARLLSLSLCLSLLFSLLYFSLCLILFSWFYITVSCLVNASNPFDSYLCEGNAHITNMSPGKKPRRLFFSLWNVGYYLQYIILFCKPDVFILIIKDNNVYESFHCNMCSVLECNV